MISVKLRCTVVCEWAAKGLACCYDASIEVNPSGERASISVFAERAKYMLSRDGWHFGDTELCPEHNTAANRKKKFCKPEKGSTADQMRKLRLGA